MEYDPSIHIDSDEWLSIEEGEREILVEDYHERAGIELPNAHVHAAIHVVVENQIAMGDEIPTRETLERLKAEGLDRHDAIHAIGMVVSTHIFNLLNQEPKRRFNEETYRRDLERLTAENWRRGDWSE
jgi:hypothetical protein